MKDFTGKAGENAARIAAILAVIDAKGVPLSEVSPYHMAAAIRIMNWYIGETFRLRSACPSTVTEGSGKWKQDPDLLPDAQKLLDWLRGKVWG